LKRKTLTGLAIVGGVIVLAAVSLLRFDIHVTAGRCTADDEIPAPERGAIEKAALQMVQTILAGHFDAAYAELTPDAQQAVPLDKFVAVSKQETKSVGTDSNLRVARTYLLTGTVGTDSRIVCGTLAQPQDWVSVAAKANVKQAHVVVEAQTKNNRWSFILWLISMPEWRVQYGWLAVSDVAGKSSQDLWDLARAEQKQKHDFNAAILFISANQLADRGPNFQLGIQPGIQDDLKKQTVPAIIAGQAPFTWKLGAETFKVLHVGPVGVDGKLYLSIAQELPVWSGDSEADATNRKLIHEFADAVPEFSAVFAGFVVEAYDENRDRGYRTVDAATGQQK